MAIMLVRRHSRSTGADGACGTGVKACGRLPFERSYGVGGGGMLRTARRRGVSRSATAKLDRLVELLAAHDLHCWDIGDLVNQLVQSHRVPLSAVSEKVNYS